MIEATAIDGAKTWPTVSRVILPLAAPALIELPILSAQGACDDRFGLVIGVARDDNGKGLRAAGADVVVTDLAAVRVGHSRMPKSI